MIIINFILFQIAWFACVVGAGKGMPWFGVMITMVVLVWHLSQAKSVKAELLLLLCALLIGAVYDQSMLSFGFISYVNNGWSSAIVPVWILALWLAFTSTLNVSLRWMRNKHLIAVIFGAVGGPLAYFGAQKLGAVVLPSTASYIALSIGWAIITPLLLLISSRFDGFVYSAIKPLRGPIN
ncbi:MAG: DUF2878 domain-containing protein [Methylotenera sp.]|uniref:DUF2878 domain-containing protein n=1 Tax=Methylotenera sp. TaxID=2051956 RepID=UPI00248A121D|nr:DUF2878 domain-containing protein [Methylotenera sp.]MDI1309509.1 DUF2878 domain-containing protein [Methylotenera sp.]